MKVLIISTTDLIGGAAIAASRLRKGLVIAGVEARMLVLEKVGADTDVERLEAGGDDSLAWLRTLNAHVNRRARAGVSNTSFSLPWPGHDVAQHSLVAWADVVNIHWVSGFVSPEMVRALLALGKPVVWTLHDERPFTGGCHYSSGCEGFHRDCSACPQLQPAYQHLPPLALDLSIQARLGLNLPTVVSPSQWLADEARKSRYFADCRVEVIPNGIDIEIFKPGDCKAARTSLGLPEKALVLMFGAFTLEEHRKGFDLLSRAMAEVLSEPKIAALHEQGLLVFAAYGKDEKSIRKTGLPVRMLGPVDSEPAMAAMLSAADLIICPTREDNLPNVVMESMACGVPVLSCRVGGVPDMVSDGEHGRLVPGEDAAALAVALKDIILDPSDLSKWGANARAKCESLYPLQAQGQAYKALLHSLAATPPVTPDDTAFAAAQNRLMVALAKAQGSQVAYLESEIEALKLKIKEGSAKVAAKPTIQGALKVIEQELKTRRDSRLPSFLSLNVWALKLVRNLLRKMDRQ